MTRLMPELPEVEFARRSLVRWFDGHELIGAEADRKVRTFRDANPEAFEALRGRLAKAERRGKYLMLAFSDGGGLVAHLGMTGKFVRSPADETVPWSRARFKLDSGEVIHFRDARLFGRIEPMPATQLASNATIRALGVDPLVDGLTVQALKGAIGSSRQQLKVALMDQGRLAGLGNIHAAEALFRAKLHPAREPASLSDTEWKRLCDAINTTITFALDLQKNADTIEYVEEPGTENPFLIYGREGEPCPACKTPVQFIDQGGRTSYFCPSCQPAPRGAAAQTSSKAKPKTKPAAKKLTRAKTVSKNKRVKP